MCAKVWFSHSFTRKRISPLLWPMETLGNDLYIIAGKNKTTAFPNMPFLNNMTKYALLTLV